jgi:hypothetical protein
MHMLLPILSIAIAMAASPGPPDAGLTTTEPLTPAVPQTAWLPSHIAVIEASTTDPAAPAVAWRIQHDPTTVRAPILRGATDRRVAQLQRHLARLGVYRGEADGVYGREVAAAVVAVHKLADIERSNDWSVEDWAIELDHNSILKRHPDEPDRVEVDIARQVMFVIRNGEITAIVPVSSANGAVYWSKNGGLDGGLVTARTPKGNFRLFRHIDGWRKNYLGSLYKPWYFTPYYAVHGSSSVPAYPASHGCIRVPTWESDHLDAMLELGLPIHIWDEPFVPAPLEPVAPPAPQEPPRDLA